MNIEHVRSFLAVVDSGTFHAAARERTISQPALTKQIQTLEAWLGAQLLDRSRQGSVPTAAGRDLLDQARAMVAAADSFGAHARRVADGTVGRLAIGFGMSSLRQVPEAVRGFQRLHPDVEVTLDDLSSLTQHERIAAGTLDVGFGRAPGADADVEFRPLWTDTLAYATVESGVTTATVRDRLARDPLARLAPEKRPGLSQQVTALERSWGVHAETATQTHDLLSLIAIASAGVSAAMIPASAAYLAPRHLHIIPVDAAAARWTIGAAWRRGAPSPTVAELLRLIVGEAG